MQLAAIPQALLFQRAQRVMQAPMQMHLLQQHAAHVPLASIPLPQEPLPLLLACTVQLAPMALALVYLRLATVLYVKEACTPPPQVLQLLQLA